MKKLVFTNLFYATKKYIFYSIIKVLHEIMKEKIKNYFHLDEKMASLPHFLPRKCLFC